MRFHRAVLLLTLTLPFFVQAQERDSAFSILSAGKQFGAGSTFRFFFGSHWRDVWTTEQQFHHVQLFPQFTVDRIIESGHVPSLLVHRDSERVLFRPVRRDVRYLLPAELRETVAREIIEDQISTANPYATVVVDELAHALALSAGGAWTFTFGPSSLPDSLNSFSGVPVVAERVSTALEQRIETDSLFARLASYPDESIDEISYLKNRLLDLIVGEWDRSEAEWQWEPSGTSPAIRWIPKPSPRDRAFSRFDGLFPSLAQLAVPKFTHVDGSYGSIDHLTVTARELDRKILISFEKQVWDSVALWMQSRLSDEVIALAVNRLPQGMIDTDGKNFQHTLASRRDRLPQAAKDLYKICSEVVEIHTTPGGEVIRAQRYGTHLIFLERWRRGQEQQKFFTRRFSDDYTREIRIFTGDGSSTIHFDGSDESTIRTIVVANPPDTVRENISLRSGVSLNPFRARSTVVYGEPHARLGRRALQVATLPRMNGIPEQEYGSTWKFIPWVGASPDEGLFIGGGMKFEQYGFREFPYEFSHQVRLGIATTPGRARADWTGEFYAPLKPALLSLYTMLSQVEVQNYFGPGNGSMHLDALDASRFYKVEQNQLYFRATVDAKIEASTRLLVSAGFKVVDNALRPHSLIDSLRPYGSEKNFSIASTGLQFLHDSRNDLLFPSGGWYGSLGFEYAPDIFTVRSAFLRTNAELRAYVNAGTSVLALRAKGESINGAHPFFESAFLGGPSSLRGYEVQRFAGDAAISGSAECRVPIAEYVLLVPQWFGVSAFAEAGRVYQAGETSSTVHSAVGGGVWFSFIKREYVGSLSVARSDEKTFFYGSLGFGF